MDQHAIDERIGLEHLEREVLKNGNGLKKVEQHATDFQFTSTVREMEIFQRYQERTEAWGWKFSVKSTWFSSITRSKC